MPMSLAVGCWFATFKFLGRNLKLVPVHRGQEETEERSRASRVAGGRFNKPESSCRRLVPGQLRDDLISTSTCQNHKSLCRGLTWVQSCFSPDGLNTLLSQACLLENGSHCGKGGQNVHSIQGRGEGEEPQIAWVPVPPSP